MHREIVTIRTSDFSSKSVMTPLDLNATLVLISHGKSTCLVLNKYLIKELHILQM